MQISRLTNDTSKHILLQISLIIKLLQLIVSKNLSIVNLQTTYLGLFSPPKLILSTLHNYLEQKNNVLTLPNAQMRAK